MDYQELPKNFKFNEEAGCHKAPYVMSPDEYQALAARTDKDRTEQVLAKLTERPDAVTLLHSVIGMVGELGEICADLQDWLFYNKPLNEANLLIEAGDIPWYHAQLVRALHTKLSVVLEANLAKLRKRFPEKYTDECAAEENRDRVAENAAVAAVVEASAPKPSPVCVKENDQGKCRGLNRVHNCPVVDPRYRDQPTAVEIVGRRHGADPDRFGEADAPNQTVTSLKTLAELADRENGEYSEAAQEELNTLAQVLGMPQSRVNWHPTWKSMASELVAMFEAKQKRKQQIGQGWAEPVLEPAESDLSKHFNEDEATTGKTPHGEPTQSTIDELMDEAVGKGWGWITGKDGDSYFSHAKISQSSLHWTPATHRGIQGLVPTNLRQIMLDLGHTASRSAAKLPPDVAIGFALAWEIVNNFVDGPDARKAAIRRIQALELSAAKNLELEGNDNNDAQEN